MARKMALIRELTGEYASVLTSTTDKEGAKIEIQTTLLEDKSIIKFNVWKNTNEGYLPKLVYSGELKKAVQYYNELFIN